LVAAARGDDPAAVRLLAAVLDSPHARKKASAQLAVLARAQGDREAADRHAKRAAEAPEDAPWPDPLHDEIAELRVGRLARERLARWLEKQRRFADAAQVYLEQLDKRPDVWAYLGAGLNLAGARDFERALPLLREAVRLGPDNAEAHFRLALALFEQAAQQPAKAPGSAQAREGFQEAVGLTRRAIELRPAHAQTYLVCGLSLKHLGEPGAAVEVLRQGIAWMPGDFQLQLGLGEALLELGRLDEAEAHLESARQLVPHDSRPARALRRLRLKKG
jgi:tetratricopeptide (TPR) repeat protein